MALIAQVQFLQVMARIGGSEGSIGMAYFANSIGEFCIILFVHVCVCARTHIVYTCTFAATFIRLHVWKLTLIGYVFCGTFYE